MAQHSLRKGTTDAHNRQPLRSGRLERKRGVVLRQILAMLCFASPAPLAAADSKPAARPNFVFILGEAQGWTSTSVQMDEAVPNSKNGFARTPNFERLANAGIRLANFYAPSPRCTPSRATFFTGKSPAQLHMTFVGEGKKDSGESPNSRLLPPPSSTQLPASEMTVAKLLKRAGYATAHFGKWHVGRIHPERYGFDESDGATNNGGPDNVANPHPKELYGMTERGLNFMVRQVRAGRPFYLQVSHYAGRRAEDALPETVAAVRRWAEDASETQIGEAAATLDLDITLGMILNKLDELGITDRTYVVFTADHGTPGRNPPLSGGKGTISEGGLRVPLLMRGPGIKPGVCCRVRATGADLFPTFAALAHVTEPLPPGLEGGSLVPVLTGGGAGTVQRPREEFVVHFPHYDKDPLGPTSAILLGDYKLVRVYETEQRQLFNLAQDRGERRDLADQIPDKVQALDARLTAYLRAVDAQMPTLNPNFDPSRPAELLPARKPKKKDGQGGRGSKKKVP